MTENTPELSTDTETVKETSSDVKNEKNDDVDDETVLEVISELSNEGEEAREPVSFEESVNHVMNLVKGTEGRLALEAAQNVVDSILIDKHMNDNVNALDQIVYGTLKEIGSNMGLNGNDNNHDMGIKEPTETIDPIDQQREEMIRNFESDINKSLVNAGPFDTFENFVPNSAKAAMYYKYQYDDDF
jgi:CheY-specific phosphatase CheX